MIFIILAIKYHISKIGVFMKLKSLLKGALLCGAISMLSSSVASDQ